jgi:DNA-binding response OmpR family regulator
MGQRLLVLDGDRAFIDEHRAALELIFEVDFVSSSQNIVKTLEDGEYAAVLISAEIDQNKGYAVCANIRNHRGLAESKIVLISSNATKSDFARHRMLRVRADRYLHKPIQTDALVSELESFVPRKASALDALIGLDIDEDWLKSLDSPDAPATGGGASDLAEARAASLEKEKQRGLATANAAGMGRLISELQGRSLELSRAREEIEGLEEEVEELKAKVSGMEKERDALEAGLQAKSMELLGAQQEIQELQRRNDSITVNLEELEERQKDLEVLRVRLQEAEDQIRYLESPSRLGQFADGVLYERMHKAVAEKKELLSQLEASTQQLAEKNVQAVELIRARENVQQAFLDVEGRVRMLERDFESRVESERRLLFSRMEELKDAEAAAKKQLRALEDECAAKGQELEATLLAHDEEKRRLLEDFEVQRQALAESFMAQKEVPDAAVEPFGEADAGEEPSHGAVASDAGSGR